MSKSSLVVLFAVALLAFSFSARSSTITATTLVDEDVNNASCFLREALVAAKTDAANQGCSAGSGADAIYFQVNGTIVLTSSLPNITKSLSILGPGVNQLTIDGDEQYRLFYFYFATDEGSYLLRGMTLIDGLASSGTYPAVHLLDDNELLMEDVIVRGMRRTGVGPGGAIGGQNASLTIRRSTFFDNSTVDGSAGVLDMYFGTMLLEDSLFVGNSANGASAAGGVIVLGNGSSVTVRRCTFSGNATGGSGGAFAMVANNASATIESSTFTNNTAAVSGGAFLVNAGTATIRNTVFTNNHISPAPMGDPSINIIRADSGVVTSLGHNFISDNTGAATAFPAGNPNANSDYVGTSATPIAAGLDTLGDYGGPTFTHRLLAASALIDKGSCPGETHDQRYYGNSLGGRIIDFSDVSFPNSDDGCDIGAFERGASAPELIHEDGFETIP